MSGGGTPFHRIVRDRGSVEELEKVLQEGIDLDQPDAGGQSPLHILCSIGHYMDYILETEVDFRRWIIQHTRNVDACDHEGIRPLHLASMLSESMVKDLLAAGADPSGATFEGLTPLHFAARARQSNIVGMLLEALSAASDASQAIDARDKLGQTPLHHACRSGRYETVLLFLAAGANLSLSDGQCRTPRDVCDEFDAEQALWADWRMPDLIESEDLLWMTAIPGTWNENAAGGLKLHDPLRPWVVPGRLLTKYMEATFGPDPNAKFRIQSIQDTARLQNVSNIMSEYLQRRGACEKSTGNLEDDAYVPGLLTSQKLSVDEAKGRIHSYERELREARVIGLDRLCQYDGFTLVQYLLRSREYDVLEILFQGTGEISPILTNIEVGKVARLLAQHGFANLLETLMNSDRYGSQVISTCATAQHNPSLDISADPILVVAAQRELPNMDVLHLLVEKGAARRQRSEPGRAGQLSQIAAFEDDDPEPGHNTALHEFAKGRHWWQVAQGIPYLLSRGADAEQRNETGQTPLELAQQTEPWPRWETFSPEAVTALNKHFSI
ncbi:hypothetical protein PG990_010714 [Apiospora arundinis]